MLDDKPNYDKNNNPIIIKRESLAVQDKAWRTKMNKEFFDSYGHWYYFNDVPYFVQKGKKQAWLNRFRKGMKCER